MSKPLIGEDYKRDWHDKRSRAHLTGACEPMYRKCRQCGDAHPAWIMRCPMPPTAQEQYAKDCVVPGLDNAERVPDNVIDSIDDDRR